MFEHKGTKIQMYEGTYYKKDDVVVESDKLFYVAESKYGKSLANNPDQALEGAKEQIDKATR